LLQEIIQMVQKPSYHFKLVGVPDALGKLFDVLIKAAGNKGAGCMHPGFLTLLSGMSLLVQGKEDVKVTLQQGRGSMD